MAKSKKQFKAEVQELLHLVIHSLYSNTDIFLRELISNASDAIDRLRFEALTNKTLMEENPQWKIKIIADKEANTLTISDNGIGMTREEVEKNIGTIAHSGTQAFLKELKENAKNSPELIGQFGVGFYSAFMAADKVTLLTRKAGAEDGIQWISSGDGSYTIEDKEKPNRGTDIILHLRDDKKDYLEEWTVKRIVRQYSDFVEYPIAMDISRNEPPKDSDGKEIAGAEHITVVEEQTLNSMKAIWMRPKSEVTEEQYKEFYQHIAHDYQSPRKIIHYSGEGAIEFKALLYIPVRAPWDLFMRDHQKGLHLYVRRVYIMDDCKELIPDYLRFVRGVVESNDLPLNVSREILQEDKLVKKIQKNIVGKILGTLKEWKDEKPDEYLTFYLEFGKVLKEGLHTDHANKEKLQELILFQSLQTEPGKYLSLREYANRMQPGQTELYYLCGENRDVVSHSPHLELFKAKNVDVLFLTDPIDEWVVQGLTEYDGKKLKAVDRGEIKLDFVADGTKQAEEKEEAEKKYKSLLERVKEILKSDVQDVKLSSRLTDSASCLVTDEYGMSAHMERLYQSLQQEMGPMSKRTLELNPNHPIMAIMDAICAKDKEDKRLTDYVYLLYHQAALAQGVPLKEPQKFAKLVSDLMVFEGQSVVKQ